MLAYLCIYIDLLTKFLEKKQNDAKMMIIVDLQSSY